MPYGKYKNPNIVQKEKILIASKLLSSRKIKLMDFREIEKMKFSKDDFIFLTLHTFLQRDTQTLRDIHENNLPTTIILNLQKFLQNWQQINYD